MRDILVHIDDGDHFAELYATALKALQGFDARVRVLWVDNPPALPSFVRAQIGEGVETVQRKMALELRAKVQAAFNANTGGGEWFERRGTPAQVAAQLGRCCDLIVVPQPDWTGSGQDGEAHIGEELLFRTGRPVLFIPRRADVESVGRRIVIAWNDSAQSARAVHDAMPLLKKADSVDLIGGDPLADSEIIAHLERRGVTITRTTKVEDGEDSGPAIMRFCLEQGADMLVMGAYGHSRLREFVLGGATRFILKHQHLGVYMAH